MVLIIIVHRDKENKLLCLCRMLITLRVLLLRIVPLLYALYKWGPPNTRQWFIVLEKTILLDVNSIVKAVVAMIGCYYSFDSVSKALECMPFVSREEAFRNKEWFTIHQGTISDIESCF